jgi:hypothetical protein
MPQTESMTIAEPPEPKPSSPILFIGQDRVGRWVVRDQSGSRGGLFVNRAEAIKFAMFECNQRPNAVVLTPECLELDFANRVKNAAND